MTQATPEFMRFAAGICHDQLAALECEHARRIHKAITEWLDSGGSYEQWWQAVSEANTYLVKGGVV